MRGRGTLLLKRPRTASYFKGGLHVSSARARQPASLTLRYVGNHLTLFCEAPRSGVLFRSIEGSPVKVLRKPRVCYAPVGRVESQNEIAAHVEYHWTWLRAVADIDTGSYVYGSRTRSGVYSHSAISLESPAPEKPGPGVPHFTQRLAKIATYFLAFLVWIKITDAPPEHEISAHKPCAFDSIRSPLAPVFKLQYGTLWTRYGLTLLRRKLDMFLASVVMSFHIRLETWAENS